MKYIEIQDDITEIETNIKKLLIYEPNLKQYINNKYIYF
jgi:hypothetical protein